METDRLLRSLTQVTRWIPPTLTIPQWTIVQIQDHLLGALNGGLEGLEAGTT